MCLARADCTHEDEILFGVYEVQILHVFTGKSGRKLDLRLPYEIIKRFDDSNYVCRLNSKDVTLPLYVRSKINGDKIEVKNLNGSKKVKDIFIDSKIALNERKTYPIVVDSNNIVVWIPGLKKSKYNKEKNEKYDIILKYD